MAIPSLRTKSWGKLGFPLIFPVIFRSKTLGKVGLNLDFSRLTSTIFKVWDGLPDLSRPYLLCMAKITPLGRVGESSKIKIISTFPDSSICPDAARRVSNFIRRSPTRPKICFCSSRSRKIPMVEIKMLPDLISTLPDPIFCRDCSKLRRF